MTGAGSATALAGAGLQVLFAAREGGLEQLPLLREALEKTGAACAEEVRGIAGMPLRLALDSIAPGTGADMLQGQGDRAIAVLDAAGWETKLLVRADRNAVFAIVEALLGGDGSQPAQAPERALSALEMGVAELFFAALARSLAAAFADTAATSVKVEPAIDEADLEAIAGKMSVAIAKYRLDAPARGGEVLIAIPRSALEALRKPLSQAPAKAALRPDPGWAQQIRKELTRADVTLTAILEERPGLLAEVFGLAAGQIIELEATPQSRVRVECNGEPLIWCDLGKSSGVYTLRVDSFIDREQEFMEDILAA
jgi:flagellar motor switch protein FliM